MEDKYNSISVVVDRKVLPGKLEEFKGYIENIIDASSKYSGYLGTDVINPEGENRYIIVFRFLSKKELDHWTASEERDFWIKKIDQVIEKATQPISLTGMERWFVVSNSSDFVPPPRYKMAIVTYLAIAPTLMIFDLLFGQYFASLPRYLIFFATSPFIVALMTYAVMPMMTKVCNSFLYSKAKPKHK
ncbi:antibiotic biosynthesis monooxygenase [Thaumasiovibrio sp. DFM-14]|uniref:antibiotic biosynthesis monooxygenase n=1 Tax=Thaumasiovibrio sp. DFM-14 TaxID=3384792 RepID=UPI0039A29777